MGASASVDAPEAVRLAKLEYLSQRGKPHDASDISDLTSAQLEISKLRNLCRLLQPDEVDKFMNQRGINGPSDSSQVHSENADITQSGGELCKALKAKLDARVTSLQEAFSKIDVTNSGYITKEELYNACWYWGVRLEDNDLSLIQSFTHINPNDPGSREKNINHSEFIELMSKILAHDPNEANSDMNHIYHTIRSRVVDAGLTMKQAFHKFDINGSGCIEANEMHQVLRSFNISYTDDQFEELYDLFDRNKDGKFQYHEFVTMMQQPDIADTAITKPHTSSHEA